MRRPHQRVSSSPFAVAFLVVCLSPLICAQSPVASTDQDHPAQHAAENLADLQLDSGRRAELQEAMDHKDYRDAEQILVDESKHDPESPRSAKLLSMAGGVFFLDGQYLDAVIAWERAEAISPLDDRNRFTLAMADIRLNRRDWARKELDKLAASQPQNALYLYWLARLDYDAQNYSGAVGKLQKVIELDPKMMRAYDSLGLCYDYMGQPEAAIQNYNHAIELNRLQSKPSPWPHVDLAVTLIGVNRLGDAEKNLREAVGYNPRLPQAHYQLGRVLEMRGDYHGAVDSLQQAVALDPAYPDPHLLLGRIYHRLDENKLGETEIEKYQQLKKAGETVSSFKTPSH